MSSVRRVTTLFLVRHGQSEWNAVGRWQGQADPSLSELGRDQAFEAGRVIGDVDAVVASPQLRAHETAEILATGLGIGPIITVDGLREREIGSWSGLTTAEIEEIAPGAIGRHDWPADAEPEDVFLERVLVSLTAVATAMADATVLVVCHGGVIRHLERHLGADGGRVPNLGGRVVTIAPDGGMHLGERLELVESPPAPGSSIL